MTGWQIVGLVLLPFAWWLTSWANEQHRQQHGVSGPSRKALARIRRTARKKGLTTHQAYGRWLTTKQSREGVSAPIGELSVLPVVPDVEVSKPPVLPTSHPTLPSFADGSYVAGHFRKDGRYVKGHYRRSRKRW